MTQLGTDTNFIEDVETDIHNFLKNQSTKRVLIFPPFNSFRRCLIHQFVECRFENLKTFSIGEGDERRTVICFNKDFKSDFSLAPSSGSVCLKKSKAKPSLEQTETAAKVQNIESPSESGRIENSKIVKRARTMPSVSIYRPPAARKLEQNASLSSVHPRDVMGGSAIQKNNLKNSEESKELNAGVKRNDNNKISVFRNAITSIRAQNKAPGCKSVESTNKKDDSVIQVNNLEEAGKNLLQNKQRRPDIKVYVPKGRRTVNLPENNCNSVSVCSLNDRSQFGKSNEHENEIKLSALHTKEKLSVVQNVTDTKIETQWEPAVSDENKSQELKESLVTSESQVLEVPETPEVNRLTSEVKQNDSSSVANANLNVSSQKPENSITSHDNLEIKEDSTRIDSCNSKNSNPKQSNNVHLNPDECDWESMFDDTGECLDPSLLEQLTTAVGDVTIEKPKSNYNEFKTKPLDVMADEFPHVIEIYNFPPEFQLQDLMTVFSQFKNSGFEIKWVDDTHALGIFSSSAVVSEVLSFYHPFVKTRSLKEGTPLSKMKARRSAEFLQPYKPRPDTCPALARRLVTGALGVKLPTSREEREAEKKILTKAREKKRLEAKQKEDAWEGTFS